MSDTPAPKGTRSDDRTGLLIGAALADAWDLVVALAPTVEGARIEPEQIQFLVTGGVLAGRDGPDLELVDCIVSLGMAGIETLDATGVTERDPLLVGMTLRYLAQGLHVAGTARQDPESLRRASDFYARSIDLLDGEQGRADRAVAIYWSARTWAALGDLEDDAAAMQEALARLREAKRLLAKSDGEQDWIDIRLELGRLLTRVSNAADNDPATLAEAIAVLDEALTAGGMATMTGRRIETRSALSTALLVKASSEPGSDEARARAFQLAQLTVDELDPGEDLVAWATASSNLALMIARQPGVGNDVAAMTRSIEIMESVQSKRAPDFDLRNWLNTQCNIVQVGAARAHATRSEDDLAATRRAVEAARSVARANADDLEERHFRYLETAEQAVRDVEAALAEKRP